MATGVSIDFSQLRQSIELQQRSLGATAIRERLQFAARAYVALLRADIRSKVSALATGNLEDALCTIVPPWKTDKGWAIGVGDIARVGLPTDAPVSRQTIREFRDWFNEALERGDAEAVTAQAKRLQARAKRRAEAAPSAKAPTLSEYERKIVANGQARQAAEYQATQEQLRGVAARNREFLRLGDVGTGRTFSYESGLQLVAGLRQRIANLRARRDVQLASALDARTKRLLSNQFKRQIADARFDLTSAVAALRFMRDTASER